MHSENIWLTWSKPPDYWENLIIVGRATIVIRDVAPERFSLGEGFFFIDPFFYWEKGDHSVELLNSLHSSNDRKGLRHRDRKNDTGRVPSSCWWKLSTKSRCCQKNRCGENVQIYRFGATSWKLWQYLFFATPFLFVNVSCLASHIILESNSVDT